VSQNTWQPGKLFLIQKPRGRKKNSQDANLWRMDARATAGGSVLKITSLDYPDFGKSPIAMTKTVSEPIAGVKNVIAVSSGKGGVGKSTVAVNLACALAEGGARVGLMDADLYGPDVPRMLGVSEPPFVEVDPEKGEMFVPPSARGVKAISMAMLVAQDQAMIWRGPMLHNMLQQFCRKVRWGELDYLIVDMPPGTGDVQLSLSQLVPITGAILVTTPQQVAVEDVRRAFNMFEKVQTPVLGLVENMSYFQCDGCGKRHELFGRGGADELAEKFNTEVLARLPIIPSVREGGDEGRPEVKSFHDLARRIKEKLS
jgi:ATP-binding protein involved in chromosome partitioning